MRLFSILVLCSVFAFTFCTAARPATQPGLIPRVHSKHCSLSEEGLNVGCIYQCMRPLWNVAPGSGRRHPIACTGVPLLGYAEVEGKEVVASLFNGSKVIMTISNDGTETFTVKYPGRAKL
jgi:hypothetical protein